MITLYRDICCVEFIGNENIIVKSYADDAKESSHKFAFDRIFSPKDPQSEIYDYIGKPIVESRYIMLILLGVLEGFNGTIFAYGQTGSGKTYTMSGELDNPDLEGLIPRIIRNIFDYIGTTPSEIEFTVKISMLEIYMEKIKDLIDPSRVNLNVREDKTKGIYIENLSEFYISTEDEVLAYLKLGNEARSISSTNMNDTSSRSHSIVIITIHQNNVADLLAKTGKLYLVDLAGSEKISKTG